MKNKILITILILIQTQIKAQNNAVTYTEEIYKNINDFGFSQYLSTNKIGLYKKAPLKYNNSFTKKYKSKIVELYKNSNINFAGKYTVMYWDGGMGTTLGTIVDFSDGKSYNIPINEGTSFNGCFDENKIKIFEEYFGSQKVLIKENSNLLVLRSCDEFNNNGIVYRFYLWDEKIKIFKLIKIVKKRF